jgi:hypothetical protein
MKQAKEMWGVWAAETYENGGTPTSDAVTSTRVGPPSLSRPAPPSLKEAAKSLSLGPPSIKSGFEKSVEQAEYECSPFDPAFHPVDDDKKLSALGACDEVYNWINLNKHLCLHPDTNLLLPPWHGVVAVIQRAKGEEKYPTPKRK